MKIENGKWVCYFKQSERETLFFERKKKERRNVFLLQLSLLVLDRLFYPVFQISTNEPISFLSFSFSSFTSVFFVFSFLFRFCISFFFSHLCIVPDFRYQNGRQFCALAQAPWRRDSWKGKGEKKREEKERKTDDSGGERSSLVLHSLLHVLLRIRFPGAPFDSSGASLFSSRNWLLTQEISC